MIGRLGRLWVLATLAIAIVAGALVTPVQADKLHLNDGRVLEGRVVREGDGFVYFVIVVGSIEHTQMFTTQEIKKIERDEPEPETAKTGAGQASTIVTPRVIADGATKITFISLEEMVGPYMNADALRKSAKEAEEAKADIVVLVINSGGGALNEVLPLSDVIHKEMKKKFRVVTWVRSAISAAAMTAFNTEEIYMMSQGNIGAAVAFTQQGGGTTKAADGEALEQILKLGEELSRRGKRNPLIMRAMQTFIILSCDIDENGIVTWYDNDKGRFVINPHDRILTLNAVDAEKYGISRGTVDTKEDLVRKMGVREWVEVGQKADEYQVNFRSNVKTVEARTNELLARYNLALSAAGGGNDAGIRNRYIGQARQILNELRGLVRRAPSVEVYMGLTRQWFAEREEELRKLAAQNR